MLIAQTFRTLALAGAGAALVLTGAALAQSRTPEEAAVAARKAHMQLNAFNIGPLVAMAKGEADYDAELATALATNLDSLARIDESRYWIPGTAQGEVEGSRALPKLFEEGPAEAMEHVEELRTATAALVDAAGNGVEALQPAVGAVGQACGSCHEEYRASE